MTRIADAVALAAPGFPGQLLRPGDAGYEERRQVHNGLIDRHPAAIAPCGGVADVVEALAIGRALGLDVAVRGGGHNVAGRATIDDGLMIDLSPMKGVSVDVAARTVRACAGVGPMVTGGGGAHPLPNAFDVLRFFRDRCHSLPDEAMLVAGLESAPDGSNRKLAGILGCHCGSSEQGEATFQSVRAFGSPIVDAMGPIAYTTLNTMIDPAFPKAARNYWKAQFLTELTDDAIRALIDAFEKSPQPYLAPMRYVNYLEDDALDAASVAYGPNLDRLRAIKTTYDPANVFRHNVNIPPQ